MYDNSWDTGTFGGSPEAEAIQMLFALLAIYAVIFGVIGLFYIANYVLRGIAIYKMSERRGISNGWLGFIPYAHNYQLGRVAGPIELGKKTIKNTGLWLVLTPIIYAIVLTIVIVATFVPYIIKLVNMMNTMDMGGQPASSELINAIATYLVMLCLLTLVSIAGQVIIYLFRGLALHRIFSFYHTGQKPVFYMIIALFVPLAEAIILFIHRNKLSVEQRAEAENRMEQNVELS